MTRNGLTWRDIPFPTPNLRDICFWTGNHFLVDGLEKTVLRYDTTKSGWTDELTQLHEDIAGENHFIDIASRKHAVNAIKSRINDQDDITIDIGCSSGAFLRSMRRVAPQLRLIGADYIAGSLASLSAALPGVPFLQFDLVTCPLFSGTVNAAVLLNVLEHIEDDVAALKQVFRILKPGGFAVLEVPAGPQLFDVYDKVLLHKRRYTLRSLCKKAESAGFEVESRSHLGLFLYPAFAFVKRKNRRFLRSSEDIQRQIVARNISETQGSQLGNFLMEVEARLRNVLYLPVGIRCLAVCRKPL